MDIKSVRILVFIGSLNTGGKERRLVELLSYLKNNPEFKFIVVLTKDVINYPDFYKLDIPYHVLNKKWAKNDPTVFYQFYKICKQFRPHIIHTWGRMQSLYTIPAVVAQKIPLVNSQITAAPPNLTKWSVDSLIDRVNFHFSRFVLSNSKAGIDVYTPPVNKARVIYNGINMNRFTDLPDTDQVKSKYKIKTPYSVVMCASFSPHKDYELFFRLAEKITRFRDDVTFIGVGGYDDSPTYRKLLELSFGNPRILFPGRISDVEALVNACTLGILFSNKAVHGEGISNSLMEYMTLGKPVIANDAGGTREIVHHNENGYLIQDQSEEEIKALILDLIDNKSKREMFGAKSRKIIAETFSLDRMGKAFEQVYREALA